MPTPSIAETVAGKLAPYLGEFNARIAVRTFSKSAFNITPEELTAAHVPALLAALQPMLNTLAGHAASESLLRQIQREVS